jgi:hypothetical protein
MFIFGKILVLNLEINVVFDLEGLFHLIQPEKEKNTDVCQTTA